jgi:vanillate O-demethylase ferredoxin subunit
MSPTEQRLKLRVRAISWEAEGVLALELVPLAAGERLPPVEAGAHVDVHLPADAGNAVRSYSLHNAPGEQHRYCIAVNRDAASRGGSRWVHEHLRAGQVLEVSPPRNHFALHEGPAPAVLIAGGIGITPLLAMARRCVAERRRWQLVHAVRSRAHAAFAGALAELQRASAPGMAAVRWHFDDEAGAVFDVASAVAAAAPEAHLYACGPAPMLKAFEAATAGRPREQVHLERFGAPADAAQAPSGGFVVNLRKSGRSVPVPAGRSILQALQAAGLTPPYSCGEGVCGTCEAKVLAGVPEHRDFVLSAQEQAANDRMMICCSGARTPALDLDL